MAKSKAGHRPAGGIGSKNVVRKPVRTGAGAKAKVVAGVAQIGQRQGNHITEQGATSYGGVSMRDGAGYNPVKYGNEVALNVGAGGPGKGREVMRTGSQGCHGSANPGNPTPKAKELWPGWGDK
jgi:hypothetical protein